MTDTPAHDVNLVASCGDVDSSSFPSSRSQGIRHPHPHDVLCGRGGMAINHIGNVHYRTIVEANKRLYHKVEKFEKMLVALSIVQVIQQQSPPGRFLAKLSSNRGDELWYDIGDAKARDKTSQALREGANEVRLTMKHEEEGGELRNLTSSPPQCEPDETGSSLVSAAGTRAESESSLPPPPDQGEKDSYGSIDDKDEKTCALFVESAPGNEDAFQQRGSPVKKRAKSHGTEMVAPIIDEMLHDRKNTLPAPLPETSSSFSTWAANLTSRGTRSRYKHRVGEHSPSPSHTPISFSNSNVVGACSTSEQNLVNNRSTTNYAMSNNRENTSEGTCVEEEDDVEKSHCHIGVETHLMPALQLPGPAQRRLHTPTCQEPLSFDASVPDAFPRVESVFSNQPPISPHVVKVSSTSRIQLENSVIHPDLLLRNLSVDAMPQFVGTASSSSQKSNLACSSDTIAAGIADFLQQQIGVPVDARSTSQEEKNFGPIGPLSDWEFMLLAELREAGDEDEQATDTVGRPDPSAHRRRPSGGGWNIRDGDDGESTMGQPRRYHPRSESTACSSEVETRRSSEIVYSVHGVDGTAARASQDGDSSPDYSNFTVTSSVFDDDFNLEDESSAYTLPERNFLGGSGNSISSIGLISVA